MTTSAIVNSGDIGDNELVTLSEACRLFFRGRLTKSSLRTEARKGNLEIIRVAGKDFVTKNGVERMVQKCREKSSPQGSGSDQTPEHGSSKTVNPVSPQNALRAMLQERKKPSPPISQKHTNHSAEVIPLK